MPFISDMTPNTPLATDPISQGDDQIRSVKLDVQSSFPAVDGAVSADAAAFNAAMPAQTAAELAAGAVVENAGYRPGYAQRYYDDGGDWSVAIQAAMDQNGQGGPEVVFPAGTLPFAATLNYPSGCRMKGQGRSRTDLSYTGTGTAMQSSQLGVRTYWHHWGHFRLSCSTQGSLGLNMTDISLSGLEFVDVVNFDTCILVASDSQPGSAVRNTFYSPRFGACEIGMQIGSLLNGATNENTVLNAYVAAPKITGIKLLNGNGNSIMVCQVEGMANHPGTAEAAIDVVTTITGTTVNNILSDSRFENNGVVGVRVGAGSKRTILRDMYAVTDPLLEDNSGEAVGTILDGYTNQSGNGYHYKVALSGSVDAAWELERTLTGGDNTHAAMEVLDSNTGSGNPVTLRAKTLRDGDIAAGARALEVEGAGGKAFGVHGSGKICTNQYTESGPSGPGLTGGIAIYDETGALLGYIQLSANP